MELKLDGNSTPTDRLREFAASNFRSLWRLDRQKAAQRTLDVPHPNLLGGARFGRQERE
jgi:hypothetical protein